MGFYPFTKADIERTRDANGERVFEVRAYDSVSQVWRTQQFPDSQLAEALRWIQDKLSSLEM